MAGNIAATRVWPRIRKLRLADEDSAAWMTAYLRTAALADGSCGLLAGLLAYQLRFNSRHASWPYLLLSLALPLCWMAAVALAGGYDARFIGVGSEEFRRVFNAGVALTAAVGFVAYASKTELARGYVVVALPSATILDLLVRYGLRKRLHRMRRRGRCMRRTIVVGYAPVAAALTAMLRREQHHGLSVVAACLAGPLPPTDIDRVPAVAGLDDIPAVVDKFQGDTVAVLACPEMSGVALRELAWQLEKTGTELCVAPALLDVAGPRTTIRPVAGLPLLHLDHPGFTGSRRLIKSGFDRACALAGLILCLPLFAVIAAAIRLDDGGPVFFRQTRVGKDGRPFTVYKFRSMVADAEQRKLRLAELNHSDGVLFKVRADPRVTRTGQWLRRWSLDEMPQLVNVALGEMSLVGPRPALPEEAALYRDHVRRRLAVKPGMTGLWQVNGRSDLSWDETVRLDLRYVENWSFTLDLQILWKTCAAVLRGDGAY